MVPGHSDFHAAGIIFALPSVGSGRAFKLTITMAPLLLLTSRVSIVNYLNGGRCMSSEDTASGDGQKGR